MTPPLRPFVAIALLCLSLPSDAFAPVAMPPAGVAGFGGWRTTTTTIAPSTSSSSSSSLLPPSRRAAATTTTTPRRPLRMSEKSQESPSPPPTPSSSAATAERPSEEEPEPELDAASRLALERQRKADLLRSQEVFMKRSTGMHRCSNCGWEYSPERGDSFLIGGMIKPGVSFEDLPSNWRCPTCRSSKDGFKEVVETIPGFEVNQGYGFGTNSMTAGQKNLLIWGGIGGFFLLFIGGYALS